MAVRTRVSTAQKAHYDDATVAAPPWYRFSSEHSPVATVATEGRTHIVRYANPAFCRLFAIERMRLLGRPLATVIPCADLNVCVQLLDRVYLSRHSEDSVQHELSTPDGEKVYLTSLAWPVFDEQDNMVGVMLHVMDTTAYMQADRRATEKADLIKSINQELLISGVREQENADRAVAEAHQQLYHAQRVDGIGKLAGGIAHDFNNLLTAIFGFTQLAADSLQPDDPVQKYIANISSAADRAALLTSQLLAFARKQVIVPQVLDVNVLILEIHTMLQRLVGEDIEIVRTLLSDVGLVKADPGQLGQVLINLAVNARDAMPNGGRLTLETANVLLDENDAASHEETTAGGYVMVAMSDNGTGMSQEIQEHLFEPYFTTKEPGKGTGLGLATCHGIVHQNGGHLEVESALGKGTTVRIYLPRVEEAAGPHRTERAARTPQGTETILLVEDEAMVRDAAAQALRFHGYTVLEAEDGKEALQVLRKRAGTVDLVVTDIVMPVMGGLEFAERVQKIYPGLRLVFMSGYADDAIVRREILMPGAAFLHKPFTPSALARKVRETLDVASDAASA